VKFYVGNMSSLQPMDKLFAQQNFDLVYDRSKELKNDREIYYHLYSGHALNKLTEALDRIMEKYPKMSIKTVTVL
jgi:hypothetical protein